MLSIETLIIIYVVSFLKNVTKYERIRYFVYQYFTMGHYIHVYVYCGFVPCINIIVNKNIQSHMNGLWEDHNVFIKSEVTNNLGAC